MSVHDVTQLHTHDELSSFETFVWGLIMMLVLIMMGFLATVVIECCTCGVDPHAEVEYADPDLWDETKSLLDNQGQNYCEFPFLRPFRKHFFLGSKSFACFRLCLNVVPCN